MDGLGYRGGARPTNTFQNGFQGESYGGQGTGVQAALLGGGGGGDGNPCCVVRRRWRRRRYGTAGSDAIGVGGSASSCMGIGGGVYGSAALAKLFLGSGAGSGGNDNVLSDNPAGGLGGPGGGILVIRATGNITITGTVTAGGAGWPGRHDVRLLRQLDGQLLGLFRARAAVGRAVRSISLATRWPSARRWSRRRAGRPVSAASRTGAPAASGASRSGT